MLSQAAKAAKLAAAAAKQSAKRNRVLLLGLRVLAGSGRQRLPLVVQGEAKQGEAAAAGSVGEGATTVVVSQKMMRVTTVMGDSPHLALHMPAAQRRVRVS
jgi:hypothetical protein